MGSRVKPGYDGGGWALFDGPGLRRGDEEDGGCPLRLRRFRGPDVLVVPEKILRVPFAFQRPELGEFLFPE